GRWSEVGGADGVAGRAGATSGQATLQVINNHRTPIGGPAGCPWTFGDCGPNGEPFTFHGNGCNALFMDGHISWINATIDPITFRRLLTAEEGIPPDTIDY